MPEFGPHWALFALVTNRACYLQYCQAKRNREATRGIYKQNCYFVELEIIQNPKRPCFIGLFACFEDPANL